VTRHPDTTAFEEAVFRARWLILLGLITAAVMEVLDTTIINVALPQMAGNLSRPGKKWPGSRRPTFSRTSSCCR